MCNSPRKSLLFLPFLVFGLIVASASQGAEVRVLTAADFAAPQLLGGTDFDAGVGDVLLRNDKVWTVISAIGATGDFGLPFTSEVLPTTGVLTDVGTVTGGVPDRNDQLTEVQHLLNLDLTSIILYGALVQSPSGGATASVTVSGQALFPIPATLNVVTTYSVTDGDDYIAISTTVTNNGAGPVPVFQIADVDIFTSRSRLPFQPFPGRGNLFPPLDFTNPFAAFGIFPYLGTVGNNSLSDGPVNNDGSPSDEVSYTYVASSVLTPLMGVADNQVALIGNAFDLAAVGGGNPPLLFPGDFLTHDRKLVVTRRNDVESTLDVALPLLGLGLRATFTGTVVDGFGNPVANAHIFFTNTSPGSDPALAGLGVPPGSPVPTTHVLTDASGGFTVKLPALVAPPTPSLYTATIHGEERDTKNFGPLSVDLGTIFGGPTNLGNILVSDTGTLSYDVTEAGGGGTVPARLRIFGAGNDNPDLGSQYLGLRNFPGLSKQPGDGLDPLTGGNTGVLSETLVGLPALNFVADAAGSGQVNLKPGNYLAVAVRGLEYTADIQSFSITAGATTNLSFEVERVVDTSGYVSADFHIHSARSFDSSAPLEDRVVSYTSKGVEVLVSTDHDNVTDYAAIISGLGLDSIVTSIVGNELTGTIPVPPSPLTGGLDAYPQGIGHWNAWPLEVINGARRDGAPPDELIPPGIAVDRLRGMDSLKLLGKVPDTASAGEWNAASQAGIPSTPGAGLPLDEEVVMLNHPRAGFAGTVVIGLFNGLGNPSGDPLLGGYDPTLPITAPPNNLLLIPSAYGTGSNGVSFDALELFNGPNVKRYIQVREDWFSLLKQGLNKAGTAVADSHRVVMENAGFPVSFVASSTDDPTLVNEDELTQNIKALQLIGTSGPFLRVSVRGDDNQDHGLGEVVVATQNKVKVNVSVQATPWIPVEEIRFYANGSLVETVSIPTAKVLGFVNRLDQQVNLEGISGDAFITVEAGVRLDANGNPLSPLLVEAVQQIEPEIVPLGFTNPIFVDRNGDGYTPPGL
jgi:hypothetical protein